MLYTTSVETSLVAGYASGNPSWIMTGDMEIEVVFRMYSNVSNGILLQFAASGENLQTNVLYQVIFVAGKMSVFHEYDAGVNYQYTEPTASTLLNRWYRWKIVRTGSQYIGYQNGVERFRTTFSRGPNTTATGQLQQLNVGSGLFSGESINGSIAYLNIKNAAGASVYTFGEDPPGVDPVNFNTYKATLTPDPFETAVPRPVQVRGGMIDADPWGYAVPRPVQKVSGYFIEPTSTGDSGGSIQAPRKAPLETRWKRANKTAFEK